MNCFLFNLIEIEIIENEDIPDEHEDDEHADDGHEEAIDGESSQQMDDAKVVFTRHKKAVLCCDLSQDGLMAVSGDQDDMAFVWNATNGEVVFACDSHKDSVICASFSEKDKYVATGDMTGYIQVWLTDGTKVTSYEVDEINWMSWHPILSDVLLAGTINGDAWMWKVGDDSSCKTFQSFGASNCAAKCMNDGKRIVMGYEDGAIRIWDLKSSCVNFAITGLYHSLSIIECFIYEAVLDF